MPNQKNTILTLFVLLASTLTFSYFPGAAILPSVHAQTGTQLRQFVAPGPTGNGRGMAFDGIDLYYTIVGDSNIYKIDTLGTTLIATISVPGNDSRVSFGGPLAWDGSALWTMNYATNSFTLYRLDPGSGATLSSCNIATQNPGHPAVTSAPRNIGDFPDGLDWTGSTLWVSSEVFAGTWVVEIDTSCNILRAFNPPVTGSNGTSGVAFDGVNLWHSNAHLFQFQTDVNGAATGLVFNNTIQLEDLAYDTVTFAPKCALWSNQATSVSNHITAYEIPCGTAMPDIDADGIPDSVELSPEMQALGMDPCRKTIALQIDYMVAKNLDGSVNHSHKPKQAAIDKAVLAFDAAPVPATIPCSYPDFPKKTSGIGLVVDVKNPIPEQTALNFTVTSPENFESIKAAKFDPVRTPYWHYALFVHDLAAGDSTSGIGELCGNDFIVSLGEWTDQTGTDDEQLGTLMHELGHNLCLEHGGDNEVNFKSNYLSLMSYAFQVVGIRTLSPDGTITTRFDLSRETLPSLTEAELDETSPLGTASGTGIFNTSWSCPDGSGRIGLISGPLDWNCNGVIDLSSVSADINKDGALETLTGFDDWGNLHYNFRDTLDFLDPGAHDLPTGRELDRPTAVAIEGFWKEFSSLKVAKFFSDSNMNLLPKDAQGNPKVDVVLANGKVTSTNPGQVLAWVNITNTAGSSVQSLGLNETLPVDWTAHPPWMPAQGAIHVFFEFVNGTTLEITGQTSITVTSGNPETMSLSISDIGATVAGKTLDPGESILLSVKMDYALKGTRQSGSSYPRNYIDAATATGHSGVSFTGTSTSRTGSAFFIAYAKVLGDVNSNLKVDILDAALVGYAYGSMPGNTHWNASADLNQDNIVNILDAATVAYYYGTKA